MKDAIAPGTYPFPEGTPDKPASIAGDPVASAEWDRVCALLVARRGLSPVFGKIIEVASASLSDLIRRMHVMEEFGRTEEWSALVAATLDTYRFCITECAVDPDPRVALRGIRGLNTEDL